jgi:hypothetical protein
METDDVLTVNELKVWKTGSNQFLPNATGDLFVTDLSATSSAGELKGIGVFGESNPLHSILTGNRP